MAEVYASGILPLSLYLFQKNYSHHCCLFLKKDPPIKRFAQRHMYLGTDAIADRDLGFALARKAIPANPLGRSEPQQSTPQGTKRASPDYRNKREDTRGGGSGDEYKYNHGNKRMRPSSPPRGADRDRETRWEGPSSRRRPFSPPPTSTWDRDDRLLYLSDQEVAIPFKFERYCQPNAFIWTIKSVYSNPDKYFQPDPDSWNKFYLVGNICQT
jgi:hypothetical protein